MSNWTPEDFRWGYSKFSTASQCLRKFKYIYVDKLTPPDLETIEMEFGTGIHIALNASLSGEDGAAYFRSYWEAAKEEGSRWANLLDVGEKLLAKFDRLHKADFEPWDLEKRITGELNGIPVEGTVDFIGLYRGVPTVLDFKTTAMPYAKEKIDAALQLYLYWHLVSSELKYPIQQVGYFPLVKTTAGIQNPLLLQVEPARLGNDLENLTSQIRMWDEHFTAHSDYLKNMNSCVQGKNVCAFLERCKGEKCDQRYMD